MGATRARARADVDVARRQSRSLNRGLPRRGWGDEYHHAVDGLFPAYLDFRAALEKRFRPREPDRPNAAILNVDVNQRHNHDGAVDLSRRAIGARRARDL